MQNYQKITTCLKWTAWRSFTKMKGEGTNMALYQIKRQLPLMKGKQKQLAEYLVNAGDDAVFLSIEELAEAADVSEATVSRFARKLGFDSYSDFKVELKKAARTKLSQKDRFERTEKVKAPSGRFMLHTIMSSMRRDIHSIEQTIASLKEEDVTKAADWIVNARRVYVIGSHSEYALACYFASTLGWIKDRVILIDESHNPTFDQAANANEEDVVIAISFPPYPKMTVMLMRRIAARGAKSIAVTDLALSPLTKTADVCFYPHDEKDYYSDNIAPAVSFLSGLLALISTSYREESDRQLNSKQEYWKEIGYYHEENEAQ